MRLQWLNYFSLKRFDIGKQLKGITKLNKGINCKNGFLKLKEIAIDSTKAEDMELVNKVDEAFHKNVENYFPFKWISKNKSNQIIWFDLFFVWVYIKIIFWFFDGLW